MTRIILFAVLCFLATGALFAFRTAATGPKTVDTASSPAPNAPVITPVETLTKADRLESSPVSDTVTSESSDPTRSVAANTMALAPPEVRTVASANVSKGHRKSARPRSDDSSDQPAKKHSSRRKPEARQARPSVEAKACTQPSGLDGLLSALNLKQKCGV